MVSSPKSTSISANVPPPLDLTSYILRADDQYVAGGGFGDVYRCQYRDGSPKEVRVWSTAHATCYLPLPQVAVKAFRFTFAVDGNVSKSRSTKVTRPQSTSAI